MAKKPNYNEMKYFVLVFLIFLTGSYSGDLKASVWLVEGNGTKLFIGSTIHKLRKQDYPLPEKFYEAFNASDIVVLESDGSEILKPGNRKKFVEINTFQDERTLKSVLNDEVYNELESFGKRYDIDLDRMKKYKPSVVLRGFIYQVLHKNGVTENGVDLFFETKAKEENKTIFYLESFGKGLDFYNKMNQTNKNELILYSLNDLKKFENFEELVNSWKMGDEHQLLQQVEEFKNNFPDLYNTLLTERNLDWISKIESYFETKETEFVLFGAMHLYGRQGILQLLKDKNYKVTQL